MSGEAGASAPSVPAPRETLEFRRVCGEFSAASERVSEEEDGALHLFLCCISPLISAVICAFLFTCCTAAGLESLLLVIIFMFRTELAVPLSFQDFSGL